MPDGSVPDRSVPGWPLQIVHEDPAFVVVNKASGFLSVPGRGPEKLDSVTTRVRALYPGCIEQPAVHRLDMDTSGLMVVALDADAHRNLSRQFQRRQTRKRYIGLLEGELKGERGTIRLPFRLDVDNRPYQIYDEVHGKLGITHWERLAIEDEAFKDALAGLGGQELKLTPEENRLVQENTIDGEFVWGDRPSKLVRDNAGKELQEHILVKTNLARRAFSNGRFLVAREFFESILEEHPGHVPTKLNLGVVAEVTQFLIQSCRFDHVCQISARRDFNDDLRDGYTEYHTRLAALEGP